MFYKMQGLAIKVKKKKKRLKTIAEVKHTA